MDNADKKCFRDSVLIHRFYFMTSVVASIASINLIYFISGQVRLKASVTSLTVCKTPQVETLIYLIIGLILELHFGSYLTKSKQ